VETNQAIQCPKQGNQTCNKPISVNLPKMKQSFANILKAYHRAKPSRLQHNIWIFFFQTKKLRINLTNVSIGKNIENDKSQRKSF